ncbi:MAG: CBS domain-containing protein [Anaerolineaceae bacterium]|nr:CBS domain-containing protein [Anaerolineaceae bacterium]
MQFTVRDWMIDLVVFIDPERSVDEGLALMRRRYIHSLIVSKTADSPEYGIITSTDICDKIIAQECNPNKTKIKEIMNCPLITVTRSMSLKECSQLMKEHHIHHLPVVDEAGTPIGMISASDFLVAAEAMSRDEGDRIS